jgi:N-acetylglucosamine-6-sulfatase
MRWLAILTLVLAFPATAAAAPNVVVIETDDQTVADLAVMPHTRALIGSQGVTFNQSVVSLSQCCPSRATLLTGRYAHNHGVLASTPPFGGADRLDPTETLAVWLQRAGYSTALVGKYMNGYGRWNPYEVPPGWSEWHALVGRWNYRYYGYVFNHDGALRPYGSTAEDYQTDVITGLAEDVVRRRAAADAPFFLWTTYVAPHTGTPHELLDPPGVSPVPAPRHENAFVGALLPRSAAFDEADVSDKPFAIRSLRRFSTTRLAALQETWQQRQESLLAVDEGVARIVEALRDAGELESTLIVFTSDNGYMNGEHRTPAGKVLPYEPSIRVPLLMRGPGIPAGSARNQLVWNGDLAPTILEATGGSAPWEFDGQSLWPILRQPSLTSQRAVLIEGPARGPFGLPRHVGVRTARHLFVKYRTGEVELYDLRRDPDQLRNLAGTPGARRVQSELHRELATLRHCRGASCFSRW